MPIDSDTSDDVTGDESPEIKRDSESTEDAKENGAISTSQRSEMDDDETVHVRRSRRRKCTRTGKSKDEVNFAMFVDARSVNEALSSNEAKEWRKAMDEEYKSLLARQTWTEVQMPKQATLIGSK
ncbi:hypothetical protein M514_12235 [Trichuris suis]|uniref:Uncharacterized protein n=1 Tax=Trichuris suis TaxID=68888 RepID=A0A085MV92_9BILA|nr:hypothetical protein M514_12235 [Trichuris suis]